MVVCYRDKVLRCVFWFEETHLQAKKSLRRQPPYEETYQRDFQIKSGSFSNEMNKILDTYRFSHYDIL